MSAETRIRANSGRNGVTLVEQFLRLSRQIETIAESLGLRIVRGHPEQAPLFERLPILDQRRVLNRASSLVEIYTSSLDATGGNLESRHLVWSAFKHFGLVPPADFFDKITDDSIIEVYNYDHLQIFSNLAFFEVCSYSFEEVSCLKWTELWEREDPLHTEMLMKIVTDLSARKDHQTISVDFPPSTIIEMRSPFKYRLNWSIQFAATVRRRGTLENGGYVAIERAKIISPRLSALQEEYLLLNHQGRLIDVSEFPESSV